MITRHDTRQITDNKTFAKYGDRVFVVRIKGLINQDSFNVGRNSFFCEGTIQYHPDVIWVGPAASSIVGVTPSLSQ
ncbi:hypothetical protein CIK75_10060 [Glutamicibacter sp. BW78]|nr:hypothetical protein CIK75_10060 [Glutamicibacter sp. BW78]